MLTTTAKKSQMEIVGLVIIVILISIALLFFLSFSLTRTPAEKRAYTSAQLTSNMINTIAKTTTNCSGSTISRLYVECADMNPVDCNRDGFKESDPCEIANRTISEFFEQTLIEWQKRFRFRVFIPSTEAGEEDTVFYIMEHEFSLCTGDIDSEQYYLPTGYGLLYMQINICED